MLYAANCALKHSILLIGHEWSTPINHIQLIISNAPQRWQRLRAEFQQSCVSVRRKASLTRSTWQSMPKIMAPMEYQPLYQRSAQCTRLSQMLPEVALSLSLWWGMPGSMQWKPADLQAAVQLYAAIGAVGLPFYAYWIERDKAPVSAQEYLDAMLSSVPNFAGKQLTCPVKPRAWGIYGVLDVGSPCCTGVCV
eukprot:SAG31_NODE_6863_length_1867_cov_1.623869_3_plen_194_part_00